MKSKAAPFAVQAYDTASLTSAFAAIQEHWPPSTHSLRAAVFNAGYGVWKPFLEITDEEVQSAKEGLALQWKTDAEYKELMERLGVARGL